MRKILLNKWNVSTFLMICTLIAVFLLATQFAFFKPNDITADYLLVNNQNHYLPNASFIIRETDLTQNTYTNPIYLINQRSSSYLRIFVTVAKQKNNEIYSLNGFNSTTLPYELTYTSDWSNGQVITENYGYDGEMEQEIGYHWRYYNKLVHGSKVEIFNSINFENGIETGYEYVVTISIDIIETTFFNSQTMWQDKPTNWQNQVV